MIFHVVNLKIKPAEWRMWAQTRSSPSRWTSGMGTGEPIGCSGQSRARTCRRTRAWGPWRQWRRGWPSRPRTAALQVQGERWLRQALGSAREVENLDTSSYLLNTVFSGKSKVIFTLNYTIVASMHVSFVALIPDNWLNWAFKRCCGTLNCLKLANYFIKRFIKWINHEQK